MQKKLITVQPGDNVAIALEDLVQGDRVQFEGEEIIILSDTKAKHKIALTDLAKDDKIFMYGVLVGKASFGNQYRRLVDDRKCKASK